MTTPAIVAVCTGLAAVVVWAVYVVRVAFAIRRRGDRRLVTYIMPTTGLLASIGALASATAYATSHGLHLDIDSIVFSFVASAGRGALAMGGLLALIVYKGPRR